MGKGNKFKEKCKEKLEWEVRERKEEKIGIEGLLESK